MLSEAVQHYLKAIYKLGKRQAAQDPVTTSLLAERLGVTPASVTNMVKKLAELRLVEHTPYQGVALTRTGEKVALEIIRHHRLLELYLARALGYPWDEVHAEADRLEHAISEELEDRIDQILGHPTIGAHGEPIPSRRGDMEVLRYRRLSELEVGQKAVIRRVRDCYPEMLRHLEELGLRLGVQVEVQDKPPFQGSLLLKVDSARKRQNLGVEVAERVFVEMA